MRTLGLGMSGTDVMEIQATLSKLGFYSGALDGIFGPQTRQAVIEFQTRYGLTPTALSGRKHTAAWSAICWDMTITP